MDEQDILDDLETIELKENEDLRNAPNNKTWLFDANQKRLIYKNAQLLLEWYSNIPTGKLNAQVEDDPNRWEEITLKEYALRLMRRDILEDKEIYMNFQRYTSNSQLFTYCLIKLGHIDEALNLIVSRSINSKLSSELIFSLLNDGVDEFVSYMSKKQIINLQRAVACLRVGNQRYKEDLIKKLVGLRVEHLTKSINKINIEINRDKTQLIKLIFNWGLGEKYNILLEGIDKHILSEDKLIHGGMIGNLRNFMSDFVIDIATKISRYKRENIPHENNRQKIGDCRVYLRDELNLSNEEHKLIDSFIIILHSEGGHSFMSEKEYFRLARNIAVEICLFMMTKAVKKYPKIKS